MNGMIEQKPQTPLTVNTKEIRKLLGISRSSVYLLVKKLTPIKLQKRNRLWYYDEVVALLKK